MDWNWFFSSAAQSAAAIVGIFAAFIITKIINNQSEFSKKKGNIKELISKSIRLEDEEKSRYFDWYNKHTLNSALEKVERKIEEDEEIQPAETYYSELNFPEFIDREIVINKINEKIDSHKTKLKQTHSKLTPGMAMVTQASVLRLDPSLAIIDKLNEERDLINQHINDTNHHIRDLKTFLDNIKSNPESSPLINFSIISVGILFFVGVIYPLSFLPLSVDSELSISVYAFWDILFSLKGSWLFAVSFIFTSILIVFLVINVRMKYSYTDIEKLELYSHIENYSKYFKIMQDNRSSR